MYGVKQLCVLGFGVGTNKRNPHNSNFSKRKADFFLCKRSLQVSSPRIGRAAWWYQEPGEMAASEVLVGQDVWKLHPRHHSHLIVAKEDWTRSLVVRWQYA